MAAHSGPKQLVIVGNGMVGHHCLEQLVEQGALDAFEIHVFGAERQRAYDRVHLSEYFGGRDAESLALGQAELYAREGVQLHLTARAGAGSTGAGSGHGAGAFPL